MTSFLEKTPRKKLLMSPVEQNAVEDTSDCSIDIESPKAHQNNSINTSGSSSSTVTLNSPITASEREMIYYELDKLREEIKTLKEKNLELQSNQKGGLSVNSIRANQEKCLLVTGLNIKVFEKLLSYLCKGTKEDLKTTRVTKENEILLTIVKLKQDISFEMLSFITDTPKTTVIDHFWKWIDIMYMRLKFLIKVADRDNIFNTIPKVFKFEYFWDSVEYVISISNFDEKLQSHVHNVNPFPKMINNGCFWSISNKRKHFKTNILF